MAERVTVGGQIGRIIVVIEGMDAEGVYAATVDGGADVPLTEATTAIPAGTLRGETRTVVVTKDGKPLEIAGGLNADGKVELQDALEMKKFADVLSKAAYLQEVAETIPTPAESTKYLDRERIILVNTRIRELQSREVLLQNATAAIHRELQAFQEVMAAVDSPVSIPLK